MSVHREVHDKTETITSLYLHREAELLDPTAEEGERTKAAKPSNQLGFALLTTNRVRHGKTRPSSGH